MPIVGLRDVLEPQAGLGVRLDEGAHGAPSSISGFLDALSEIPEAAALQPDDPVGVAQRRRPDGRW